MATVTQQEIDARLAELAIYEERLTKALSDVARLDPFWSFVPSDGELTDRAKEFLDKWIKPEDIPQKFYGVKHVAACESPIIGMFGGNRAGKTIWNAVSTHIAVTGEMPEALKGVYPQKWVPTKWPVNGRVYAGSNDVIEEVLIPKFKEWMPRKYWHEAGWERTYNSTQKILRYYKNGRTFVGQVKFVSTEKDVEKTQGVDLDFAHFDEEPPYEFYEEALSRFGTGKMRIRFFLTPTNGLSWVYDTVLKEADGGNISTFLVATVTNKYADYDSLDILMSQIADYEARKMRILGSFVSLSGLIYKGENALDPRIHVIDPFPVEWEKHVIYRGLDVHLSKPTCCVEIAVDPAGLKYVVGVYYAEADTEKVKADLAKRAIDRNYRLAWTRFDKSLDYKIEALGGINIVEKLRTGANAIPAMIASNKYEGSIEAGVNEIKLDLKLDPVSKQPKVFFFRTPEVMKLVNDIQTLERDKADNEDKKGKRDKIREGKKDRHAAFRYPYQGRMVWLPPEESDVLEHAESISSERYL